MLQYKPLVEGGLYVAYDTTCNWGVLLVCPIFYKMFIETTIHALFILTVIIAIYLYDFNLKVLCGQQNLYRILFCVVFGMSTFFYSWLQAQFKESPMLYLPYHDDFQFIIQCYILHIEHTFLSILLMVLQDEDDSRCIVYSKIHLFDIRI